MNEVLSALGGAMLSWLAQSASARVSQGRQRQDATTLALAQLTSTVAHLDGTLQRHERCMANLQEYLDKARDRLQDHDTRLALLEHDEN